jgi:NADH-quinone oxidoreductase subunit N
MRALFLYFLYFLYLLYLLYLIRMIPLIHHLRLFLSGDGSLILPELELILFALGIFVIDRWLAAHEKHWNAVLALGGVAFSAFTLYVQYGKMAALRAANPDSPGLLGIQQSLLVDPFFLFFAVLFLLATALIIMLAPRNASFEGQAYGPDYALPLVACAGMMLVASGVNVIAIFAGIQLMALSCFLLLRATATPANAAATRGFAAIWACASFGLAMGFLLLYGNFKTTNLGHMGAILEARMDHGVPFAGLTTWPAVLALAFLAAGTFLCIEAAPLHLFAPAIYESAPPSFVAFLNLAVKTAGFALLLRLYAFLFLFGQQKWIHLWGAAAILSLLWGNLAALRTRSVMQLLAYSSVAHTGFLILGLVAANDPAFTGIAYYTGTYVFSAAGIFGILLVLQQSGMLISTLTDLHGLSRRSPALALLLLLFMLSLIGVPATAGFVAKYYIVKGVIAGHPELGIFAIANVLLSTIYYGRLAAHAFRPPVASDQIADGPRAQLFITNAQTVALTVAAFVSLAAGLYPAPFLRMASYVFGS